MTGATISRSFSMAYNELAAPKLEAERSRDVLSTASLAPIYLRISDSSEKIMVTLGLG